MPHNMNHIEHKLDCINRLCEQILLLQNGILKKEYQMSATLDQVLQDVKDESTVADSIITLLNGVEKQLKDVLANTSISPADQAKIDSIFDGVESNKAKVASAVTANTPALK